MVVHNNLIRKSSSGKNKKEKVYLHNLLNKISEDILNSDWYKEQQAAEQTARRPTLNLDPEGYYVYIGVPKDPYWDDVCPWVIILHNRSSDMCQWFYTFNTEAENPDRDEDIWKRQYYSWPCNHFKCEEMTTKRLVGALEMDQRTSFLITYTQTPEQPSKLFVKAIMDACVGEDMFDEKDVASALADLQKLDRHLDREDQKARERQ
ncbi:uncharacterized protein BDV17DRAFT_294491 [Aspergillus undulatus]|uniref:uncharacterized protein n=1 Tax=Aspergillus undulatus TaxID=1810928 RepID=UPI003CCD5662